MGNKIAHPTVEFWRPFRMQIVLKIVVVAFCAIYGSGCDKRPYKQNTSKSEIVGVWEITDSSLAKLIEAGYKKYANKKSHRFEFFEDGTCSAYAYHSTVSNPTVLNQERDYIKSEKATWEITTTTGFNWLYGTDKVPAIKITEKIIETTNGIGFKGVRESHFFISSVNGEIVLWYYIGDPDYRQYMDFVKMK